MDQPEPISVSLDRHDDRAVLEVTLAGCDWLLKLPSGCKEARRNFFQYLGQALKRMMILDRLFDWARENRIKTTQIVVIASQEITTTVGDLIRQYFEANSLQESLFNRKDVFGELVIGELEVTATA